MAGRWSADGVMAAGEAVRARRHNVRGGAAGTRGGVVLERDEYARRRSAENKWVFHTGTRKRDKEEEDVHGGTRQRSTIGKSSTGNRSSYG